LVRRRARPGFLRVPQPGAGKARGKGGGEAGGEAEVVSDLLLRKLEQTPGPGRRATDTLDVRTAFVRHRFAGPVTAYEREERFYSRLDSLLNLVSIAAGIAASLLVASGSPNGWTISLGVVVAGCQTLSQWLKPGQRAVDRGRAASRLRIEAWDLLQERDRYRGKDMDRAWDVFCRRVEAIEGREQGEEDAESSSSALSGLGTGAVASRPTSPG
jgi:hypothetical protein